MVFEVFRSFNYNKNCLTGTLPEQSFTCACRPLTNCRTASNLTTFRRLGD